MVIIVKSDLKLLFLEDHGKIEHARPKSCPLCGKVCRSKISNFSFPKNTVVNLLVYRLIMPIIISVVTSVAKVILSCTRRGTDFEAIALAVEKL